MPEGIDTIATPTPTPVAAAEAVATPTLIPTPAPAALDVAEGTTEESAESVEKKPTIYVVLVGPEEKGPFERIGTFEGHGQLAAKKLAAAALTENGTNANDYWFLAIPASSFVPEKPQVKVTTVVSF